MRQLIALAIVAALGVGGWMFRDQIKAMIVSHAEGDGKTTNEGEQKTPPAAPGTTTPTTPGTTTPGATTPGTLSPGQGDVVVPKVPGGSTGAQDTPPFDVSLTLRVVPDEKGEKFTLEGATNLLPETELELAITARTGALQKERARVVPGSPKNTFKTVNHQLPDGPYQIDVIMYATRQTSLALTTLYSQPKLLKGPMVFNTNDGIVVRATGTLQRSRQRKAPSEIALKAGRAK